MKIVNVILSVLILVLAALSAVASYFLFVKREQLLKGWEQMARTINQTASELDRNSGTNVAAELTPEKLAHTNYEQLGAELPKLNQQAKNLVEQRDQLAETVRRIDTILDLKAQELANYTQLTQFANTREASLRNAQDFKNNRDSLVKSIADYSKKVGVTLNEGNLKGKGGSAEFKKFSDRVEAIRAQCTAYEASFRRIATSSGAAKPNFNANAYKTSLAAIEKAVQELKSKYDNAMNQVEKGKRDLAAANNKIKNLEGQISTLNGTIQAKDGEIKQYRVALGLDPSTPIDPWQKASEEARRAVRGKVVEINEKFGFYALDIGSGTLVTQQIGTKTVDVSPDITAGMELFVARNMDTAEAQYIGRIRLTNVDADCSIAEIIDLATDRKISAGDAVFFYRPLEPKAKEEAAPAAAQ